MGMKKIHTSFKNEILMSIYKNEMTIKKTR